jgi:hypothetical protein
MAWTDGSQQVWTLHPYSSSEFFDSHSSDYLAECVLQGNAFLNRCQKKFSGKFPIPQILR